MPVEAAPAVCRLINPAKLPSALTGNFLQCGNAHPQAMPCTVKATYNLRRSLTQTFFISAGNLLGLSLIGHPNTPVFMPNNRMGSPTAPPTLPPTCTFLANVANGRKTSGYSNPRICGLSRPEPVPHHSPGGPVRHHSRCRYLYSLGERANQRQLAIQMLTVCLQ